MAADEFESGDGPLPSSEVLGWYAFKSTFSLIAAGVFGITRGRSAPPLSNNEHLGTGSDPIFSPAHFLGLVVAANFLAFGKKKRAFLNLVSQKILIHAAQRHKSLF